MTQINETATTDAAQNYHLTQIDGGRVESSGITGDAVGYYPAGEGQQADAWVLPQSWCHAYAAEHDPTGEFTETWREAAREFKRNVLRVETLLEGRGVKLPSRTAICEAVARHGRGWTAAAVAEALSAVMADELEDAEDNAAADAALAESNGVTVAWEDVKATLATPRGGRVVRRVEIFWDDQDSADEGWAYRVHYTDGHEESGACSSGDPNDAIGDLAAAVASDLPDGVDAQTLPWEAMKDAKGWTAIVTPDELTPRN